MFKQGTRAHAVYSIIEAVLLFVVGILALVYRANVDAYSATFTVLGVLIIIAAAFGILMDVILTAIAPNFSLVVMSKTGSIVTNSMELAIGIAFVIAGSQFNQYGGAEIVSVFNFGALFVGLAMIVAGGIFLIYSTMFLIRAPKENKKGCIFPFAVAVGLLTFGILDLALVWNADKIMEYVFVIAGILLLAMGVGYLVYGILEFLGKAEKRKDIAIVDDDPNEPTKVIVDDPEGKAEETKSVDAEVVDEQHAADSKAE
jgi:hypothetical protein